MSEVYPALLRLEDRLKWYSRRSVWNKQCFQLLKAAENCCCYHSILCGYAYLAFLTGFLDYHSRARRLARSDGILFKRESYRV